MEPVKGKGQKQRPKERDWNFTSVPLSTFIGLYLT